MKAIKPQRPKKGDLISVISPASCPKSIEKLDRGYEYLQNEGFEVKKGKYVKQSWHYLAGKDDQRMEDMKDAFKSEASAIIPSRGGYGCARLIPFMEQIEKPEEPKVFMGYSDITSIHSYIASHWNWVTYYGPMVAVEFGREDFVGSFTEKNMKIFLEENPSEFKLPELPYMKMESLVDGKAEGELIGGCLSILVPTLGTRYEPDFQDKILFWEEIGESQYKIDRMILHMANAGVFDKVKGVIIGENIDCETDSYDLTLKELLLELLRPYNIPVILNAPFGHGDDKIIFPNGIKAYMDSANGEIRFLEKIWED